MGKVLDLSNYKKDKAISDGELDRTQLNNIIEYKFPNPRYYRLCFFARPSTFFRNRLWNGFG